MMVGAGKNSPSKAKLELGPTAWNEIASEGAGYTGSPNVQRLTDTSASWYSQIACTQLAPRARGAGVGSPSRHRPQDRLLKLYSLQNLYQRHKSVLGRRGGLDLQSSSDVTLSPGRTNLAASSVKGYRLEAKARLEGTMDL